MVQIRESDGENNFGLFLLFLNISVLVWKLPLVFCFDYFGCTQSVIL
jgi:hypothetical protein